MRTKLNEGRDGLEPIGEGHVPERTCVLTRRKGQKTSSSGSPLGRTGQLPRTFGRALQAEAHGSACPRDELDLANAKGKLKGALQRALRSTMSRCLQTSVSGPRLRFARRRSTGSGWKHGRATSSTAPNGSKPRRVLARSSF